MGDIAGMNARAIREAVRAGILAPQAAADAAIAKARAMNADLRAFIAMGEEPVLANADGPVHGVPLAVKDNIAVAGRAPSAGIAASPFPPAGRDARLVALWRAAGGALVGRLNMHEGALGATSDNPAFGRIDNPAAPGFTPGGSSGGSAAAVAAGIVPVALGTDTMGSVRIPASYCGVVGFKPSRGVLSRDGIIALSPTLDHAGVFARDVADAALAFDALAVEDPRDPASRALPAMLDDAPRALAGLVFGLPESVSCAALEPEVAAAFDAACARLREAGARIEPLDDSGFAGAGLRKEAFLVSEVEGARVYATHLANENSGLSAAFRKMLAYGRDLPGTRYAAALQACERAGGGARRAAIRFDAILSPTTPQRAFPHGARAPVDQADFTVVANASGLPAISVPMPCWDRPAGLQLTCADLADRRLLAIATLVEAAIG
ncbi:MAG: amidase [Salinarimonadaceae bacterium]|nr:MAG: amidase [Salinarimonadaceae bacterium]